MEEIMEENKGTKVRRDMEKDTIEVPKFSDIYINNKTVEGISDYEFGDEVTLVVKGEITQISKGGEKTEYIICPDDIKIELSKEKKKMIEMDVDKKTYEKVKKAGMILG